MGIKSATALFIFHSLYYFIKMQDDTVHAVDVLSHKSM